jgi:predicted small secreted protein
VEFVLGSIVTIAAFFIVSRFILSEKEINNTKIKIVFRQSHLYEVLKPYIDYMPLPPLPITQAYKHDQSNKLRVVFTDSNAYWIKDNAFYQADLVDGMVDESTTKVVDTMAMDKVELDKMIFIVQQLTEGMTNDSGSPGDKDL